jgi:RNA polymerase sigma-70 factor (ECF subfamily)
MDEHRRSQIFAEWLDRHRGLVARVARVYADTLADQDDVAQEILMQLWASIPAFRGDARETTWVYRISLNVAMNWRRGQFRRRRRLPLSLIDPSELPAAQSAEYTEAVDKLYIAIRRLHAADSSVLLMHLDGLSYGQIASVLGCTSNNVGVRLSRAKKRLAKMLEGLADEL